VVDWSVQNGIEKDDTVLQLFGEAAPLATLKIVSAKSCCRPASGASDASGVNRVSSGNESDIQCLSCVLVAGRAGQLSALDYMKALSGPFKARSGPEFESIKFCVDMESGRVGAGRTRGSRMSHSSVITQHPDTGATISGLSVPGIDKILAAVQQAHRSLAPGVPMVGWDVALTAQQGYLMEGNFSCELLQGCFDQDVYYRFLEDHFADLEERQAA
jgi:hypothetical protein